MDQPIRVAVGVPHLGPLPQYFVKCLLSLQSRERTFTVLCEGDPVDIARNHIVEAFLSEPDATHLFFMDSDMVFPADALDRLLAHDLPIVSGTYFARTNNPVPHVYDFVRTDELGVRWYHPKGEAFVEWIRAHPEAASLPNVHAFPDPWLVKCDGIGGGCLLIKREVFERMPAPWFENALGSKGGEDFDFCEKAKRLGYEIWADFAIQCDHEARPIFTGREEFTVAFGIGTEREYDFNTPLIVQVGPNGRQTRKQDIEVFRFPHPVEGYLTQEEGLSLFRLACKTPETGHIVELGSYKGRSAICLAQSGRRVTCVDHGRGETAVEGKADHMAGTYLGDLQRNLSEWVPRAKVDVWADDTASAGKRWNGGCVSMLFVDAAHDYASVRADWDAWAPHLSADAIVAFHDTNWPGVRQLLTEVVSPGGWDLIHQQDSLTAIRRVSHGR